MTNPRRRKGRN